MVSLKPSVLVLVGAGASTDAANASGPVRPELQPPIAREIFQYRKAFEDVLREYPGAKKLKSGVLGPRSASGTEFDLESELDDLRVRPDTARAFREVPPFLRDVFQLVSNQYLEYPETYLSLAMGLARDHDVAYVSLNYDTLLEQAVDRAYDLPPVSDFRDYLDPARPLIVKPHGSIDWWHVDQTGAASFKDLLGSPLPPGGPLRFQRSTMSASKTVYSYKRPDGSTREGRRLYPALTAPLAEKSLEQVICPPEHLAELAAFQRSCLKYLFIGTSGWDTHVLDVLNRSAAPGSTAFYVGGWAPVAADIAERAGNETRSEFQARRKTDRTHAQAQAGQSWKRIGDAMTNVDCQAEPFDAGFLAYSTAEAFERFLAT